MKNLEVIKKIKPEICSLAPYKVKEADEKLLRMNLNENPYDLPAELKKEILDYAMQRSWSRYPPIIAKELYRNISAYTGWDAEGIIAGNGSDEMILTLLISFIGPGKTLVAPTPTFPMYKYFASIVGAETIEVPMKEDYSYDCDTLERAFLEKGDLLIICNPNNPTGALFPLERLEKILEKTDKPVILDEAYCEFSGITAIDMLKKYANLLIMRTFSKAFSMAGLRVGYVLMNPELAIEIGKCKIPFNLNFFSIAAVQKIVEHREVIDEKIKLLISEREILIEKMKTVKDVRVYETHSNFILFKTPYSSTKLLEKIIMKNVLIRDLSANPTLANTLRVTVSLPEENTAFFESLKYAMEELSKES
jgi:histidinol-phosphate aminotransferase